MHNKLNILDHLNNAFSPTYTLTGMPSVLSFHSLVQWLKSGSRVTYSVVILGKMFFLPQSPPLCKEDNNAIFFIGLPGQFIDYSA